MFEIKEKVLDDIVIGVSMLWCKGRVNVKEYYTRLGFEPYGEAFDYPTIGLHVVMVKRVAGKG